MACDSDSMGQFDADGKYKTELCKNWVETTMCRYEDKCRFAHGQEELTLAAKHAFNDKFKSKNCRSFYHAKQCMYGAKCLFRHEHRSLSQLHRHYYTPQIFVLETLYQSATCKSTFVDQYQSATARLSVFERIYEEADDEEVEATHETSESELSEIEMSTEMHKAASCSSLIENSCKKEQISRSSLNSTQDSTIEQSPHKFALKAHSDTARLTDESADLAECASQDSDDLDVSLRSLGLDFV